MILKCTVIYLKTYKEGIIYVVLASANVNNNIICIYNNSSMEIGSHKYSIKLY